VTALAARFARKVRALEAWIRRHPALADVPFATVAGRPVNPRELLSMLRRGEGVPEALAALSRLGIDPPGQEEEEWRLAEEYFRRLLEQPGRKPVIMVLGQALTVEQALRHVRARDAKGRALLAMYRRLRAWMATRVG